MCLGNLFHGNDCTWALFLIILLLILDDDCCENNRGCC